jgi:predicted kinase
MCYKPIMQKWTRDRNRRRQKSKGPAQENKSAQAPLQPAYFDADINLGNAAPEAETKAVPHEPVAAEPEPAFEPGNVAEPVERPMRQAAGSGQGTPGRRRRRGRGGRGGRGRGSQSQRAAAAAAAPDAVAEVGSAPPDESIPAPETVAKAAPPPSEVVPAAAAVPSSKGVVVLAIGLPGSGKSSWFKRHKIHPLSSDLLRELLFDNADEQRFQDLIFSNLRSMLKARLIARRPLNYVDATNLTPHDRHSWIKLAKDYRYDVQAVYFDVPVEVCLERNQRRERIVPEDVMRRFAAKLRPPTFDEGFSKITVVRVKKKE